MITARVHQKATIVSTNRLICLRCVLGNDEARTGNMESFEVGPFSVSLIFRHGFIVSLEKTWYQWSTTGAVAYYPRLAMI